MKLRYIIKTGAFMDILVLPLIFLSPCYVPALFKFLGKGITSTERKHPAVSTENDIFLQMKKNAMGFKLTTTISLCAIFVYCLVSLIFFTEINDGALMCQILFLVASISIAIIGSYSFQLYNYLFLAETNLKAGIILAFPFFGSLPFLLLFISFFSIVIKYLLFAILPFIVIYITMLIILCIKRKNFPDSLTLKIMVQKQQ